MENAKCKWTSAVPITGCEIHCPVTCVALGDLYSDGDTKLVVAHGGHKGLNMKLRVFKGVTQCSESNLADVPTAIIHFVNELSSLPSLAVASGPSLLIYKNLKPFYKFTSPSSEINPVEEEAWASAGNKSITVDDLYTVLSKLVTDISVSNLTPTSQTMLLIDPSERQALLDRNANKPLTNSAPITCVAKMKKSSADVIDVLLVGTEHGDVCVIDSQAFTTLQKCKIPSAPVSICTFGTFDVKYNIFVLTRDSSIYAIKRDDTEVKMPLISSQCMITAMIRINKMLVYTTSENEIHFVNLRGRKIKTAKCENRVKMLEVFDYEQKQFMAVLVMFDREVKMYNEMYLLDVIKFDKPLSWIKFGSYGREDGSLICCFKDGSVSVRMFRRTANLDEKTEHNYVPPAHSIKLAIPKKTKIFIDQTIRERDNTIKINQAYQKDLFLLRCRIAETFQDLTASSSSIVSSTKSLPIAISVDIHGFGPSFRITIYLESSAKFNLFDMMLSMICDTSVYEFEIPLMPISFLAPGHKYSYTTLLTCKDPEKATQEEIRILLLNKERCRPIVTAIMKMPPSEFPID